MNTGDAKGAFSARSVLSAIVPSLSWNVYVRAAVFVFVRKLVKVFATFLKFIFSSVSPAYPPLASFPDTAWYRVSKYVFRNAFRFVNVSVFIAFDAALSKILKLSASTGVVFPAAPNCFVPSVASVSSPVFVPEFVPVISDIIATVPSLSGKVYVLAAVFVFVRNEVIEFATFLIFSLNRVSPAYPLLLSLFAEFSAVYPKLFSDIAQFAAVVPGVSTIARITSPAVTATPPRVPATDIVHRSHLRIAPAVPDPPVEGHVFADALKFPRSSIKPTTSPSAYAFAALRAAVSAVACAVDTGLFTSDVLSTFPSPISAFVVPCGFPVAICE